MPELLAITDRFADVGIIVAFIAAFGFVVSYATFFRWRKTPAGRSLLYFVAALIAVAFLSFLGRWLGPEYWGRVLIRPIVWWTVAGTAIRLTWVLWTSSRNNQSLDIESRPRKDKDHA